MRDEEELKKVQRKRRKVRALEKSVCCARRTLVEECTE
jgi:hypothetical protein